MDKFKIAGEKLNKGAELLASGKVNQAITAFKSAIKINPKIVAAHFDLALAYQQKGDVVNIIKELEITVKLKPDDAEALNLLGHYYNSQKKTDLAISTFQKAIKVNPFMSDAQYNLGVCYMQKGNYEEAINYYKKSLKLNPNNPIVMNNIGVALENLGRPTEALTYFNKSLKLNPNNTMALSNIGAYWVGIDAKKAGEYFKKAFTIDPTLETAAFNLAVCLRILGQTEDSIKFFEKALELNPDSSVTYGQLYHQVRDICDFKKAKTLEVKMKKLTDVEIKKGNIPAETGFVSAVYDEDPKRNLEVSTAWSKYIADKVKPYQKEYSFKDRQKNKKIRIGYLSNDFKNHATSHLLMGLLRNHDKSKFEVFAYSYGENDKSIYRNEIEKLTKFRDIINLSFADSADLIYKDKIDILIDLKGHTANSRLEIPALRPAPVQINYLGFPGTSGAKFFDYFITDHTITPKPLERYFSEKLIFMPHSYQITDNMQKINKKIKSREKIMFPPGAFIFCSFNQPYKIEPRLLDSWARILKSTPGSAVALLAKNNTQLENIKSEFKSRGVDPMRILFSIPMEKSSHLARLALCDLALDTFTCNGHTSTTDALWAGLPVVTLQGKHFASRVSSSLLKAAEVPQLITKTQKEYEDLAISLGKNSKKLNKIRESLIVNRESSHLFDSKGFTRDLESQFEKVWKNTKLVQ